MVALEMESPHLRSSVEVDVIEDEDQRTDDPQDDQDYRQKGRVTGHWTPPLLAVTRGTGAHRKGTLGG